MRPLSVHHTVRSAFPAGLLLAACAGGGRTATALFSPGAVEEPVTAVLTAALRADSRLEPADSLWSADAAVVANGELRHQPPRFAGIGIGGEAAITSSRLEVRQSVVWVFFEYRWLSMQSGAAQEGRATVLLTPQGGSGAWRIVHAHSSTAK